MSADDGAGADVKRSCEQFREKVFAEHDGVPAVTLVSGQDDGFFSLVEGGDKRTDKMNGDERMVDEEEQGGFDVFFGFDGVQSNVEGRERTSLPVFVDEYLIRSEAELGADFVGVAAEDDAGESDARVASGREEVFEKGEAAVRDQGFGAAHASGFTGGEDDGGDHWELGTALMLIDAGVKEGEGLLESF